MSVEPAYLVHYAIGSVAILLFWSTILRRKGGPAHRMSGKVFFAMLPVVLLSVGGIFFLSSRVFATPEVIQFLYLSLCVVTVGGTAFAAIGLKNDLERFRGAWFRVLGVAAFLMGAAVLVAGVAIGRPLPIIFSMIGLVYGGAMIRFAWLKEAPHPNWWLSWHLNGVCLLFNAVHGTFLAVTWQALVDPTATDDIKIVTQLSTMGAAIAMRVWFGQRYRAPLRFTQNQRSAAATPRTRNRPRTLIPPAVRSPPGIPRDGG